MGAREDDRHWHVRITVSGNRLETLLVRAALQRLSAERPFLHSVAFTEVGAELEFWDQGDSLLDVASLALRLWNEHRVSAGLPHWEVVGLEVLEKSVHDQRGGLRPVAAPQPTPLPILP